MTRSFGQQLALAGIAVLGTVAAARAADHREAPLIREDLPADINDIYAFVSPNNSSNLVLIMTVNPLSAPSENITYNFSPNVNYVFNIDNTGDAIEDAQIIFAITNQPDGSQTYAYNAVGMKVTGLPVTAPTEEPQPNQALVDTTNGISTFVGQRDDPFFFDVVGFNLFLAGTGGFDGTDGFAGYNVSAIAIELPISIVSGGSSNLQVWGVTERAYATVRRSNQGLLQLELGPYQQIERMGNPAISTALIPLAQKDLYNIGQPSDDAADFADEIVASLMSLGTNAENIDILASVAVPDTLKIDTTTASAYPNGRALEDDVIDTLFFFIFNQPKVPVTDMVDSNDKAFLTSFPYLAPPHQP